MVQKYLKWYFDDGNIEMFNNLIKKSTNFEFTKVTISPDCQKMAVFDATNYLTIYDTEKKEELVKFHENKFCDDDSCLKNKSYFTFDINSSLPNFKFSWDSKKLALRTERGELKIFNLEKMEFEERYKDLEIENFYFSKSIDALALIFEYSITIIVKDVNGQDQEFKQNQTDHIFLGDFCLNCPDLFCYSTQQKTIYIWNFRSGQLTKIKTEGYAIALSFSDSGRKIIAGFHNKMVKIYCSDPIASTQNDPSYKKPKIIELDGNNICICYLIMSSNEDFILGLERDDENSFENVILWREKSDGGYVSEKIEFNYSFSDFAKIDNRIVGINFKAKIHYFEKEFDFKKDKDSVCFRDCFYSPKEDFMLSMVTPKKFALIDENTLLLKKMFVLQTKKEEDDIPEFIKAHFSLDGSHVIIHNAESLFIFPVYDSEKPLEYEPINLKEYSEITALLMITNNILIGQENGQIVWFSIIHDKKAKPRCLSAHMSKVISFAMGSNMEILASGDSAGNVFFWDKHFKKIEASQIKGGDSDNDMKCLLFSKLKEKTLFILYQNELRIYDLVQNTTETNVFQSQNSEKSEKLSFMTLSEEEDQIFINHCQREILILKENGKGFCLVQKFSNFPINLIEVRPNMRDKNTFVCKFNRSIYEMKNSIQKRTIEV